MSNHRRFATELAAKFGGLMILTCATTLAAAPPDTTARPTGGPDTADRSRALGVPVGPLTLYPTVDLRVGYDDNLFLQPSNEKSTAFTVLAPTLDFRAVSGGQRYGLLYRAEAGRYRDSRDDDYTDQQLLAEADVGFSERGRLALQVERLEEHDARGTAASEGNPLVNNRPDFWHSTRVGATLRYGVPEAQGRLVFALNDVTKRYENNPTTTAQRDFDQQDATATFFYRAAPRTSLLFQAYGSDHDYKSVDLDSTEQRYLVGVTWEATAKTNGTVKVGRQQKDFDSAARNDFSGASWSAQVTWSPRTYSLFELTSNRKTEETNGTGDFNDRRDYGLAWTHNWTSFTRTQLGALRIADRYRGPGNSLLREDDTTEYAAKISYQLTGTIGLAASYTATDRGSTNKTFEYKRHVTMLTASARW